VSYHGFLNLFLSALLFCNELHDFPAIATKKATLRASRGPPLEQVWHAANRPETVKKGPLAAVQCGCPSLGARL
jgi:hypothetical protein